MTQSIESRLCNIESLLARLLEEKSAQEFYSIAEVAKLLDKAEFTVREWCRRGRVNAQKRQCGRGGAKEWIISKDELDRIRSLGILPAKDGI